MSTLGDIFSGLQDIITIRKDVAQLSTDMVETQRLIREIDSRLIRIETFVEIGQRLLLPPR